MAKLNKFKSWLFHDLTQLVTRKPFQNETISCFHTTPPPARFWSFLEFSKREEQYLNRTKENEASEDNVNLSGALLAFPRSQLFQLPFSQNETLKDSSALNISLNNFKKDDLLEQDSESFESKTIYKTFSKESPSKTLSRIPPMKKKRVQSASIKMEKPFSILNSENEKSSTAFMLPVEANRLRRSKSFSDHTVSGYSSESGPLGMRKTRALKSSIQVANMSSGKRNNRNRKKSKNNANDSQECPPPCPPPPPPPQSAQCCPPPPPPPPPPQCCPEPPPPKNKKSNKSSSDCQPPPEPQCIPYPTENEPKAQQPKNNKQKNCNGWCPDSKKGECYKSKCPEKKKNPCPKPRICRPQCFEPDPCEKPKSFCVGCPPKKKNSKDREFSTWTKVNSPRDIASRSFATDQCGSKVQNAETVEERFNKRIPKPGPACKEAKDDDKCKTTASVKPNTDKSNEKSATDKKPCQNGSSFLKNETQKTKDLVKEEFEQVQRCKQGTKDDKKSQTESNKCLDKKPETEKSLDKKPANEKCLDTKLANEKSLDKKPANEKCLDKKPVNEKCLDTKPVTEKSLDKKPANEKCLDKKPVNEKCLDKKPEAEKSLDKKPANEKCLDKNPVTEKSLDKKREAEKCLDKKPVTEKSLDKKPEAEKCLDKKPEAEKCLDKKPVAEKSADKKPETAKSADKKPLNETCWYKKVLAKKDEKCAAEKDKKSAVEKDKKSAIEKDTKSVNEKCWYKKSSSKIEKANEKCATEKDKKSTTEKDAKSGTEKCWHKKFTTEKNKNSEVKKDAKPTNDKCLDNKSVVKSVGDEEVKIQSIIEKIINPSKIEKLKNVANKTEDAKCGIGSADNSIGSPYKKTLAFFQTNDLKSPENKINHFRDAKLKDNILNDSSVLKESLVNKELASNFGSRNAIKEVEPRNWLFSWFF